MKFWSAASLSLAGDAVTTLALPLIAIGVLEATPFQIGLLGGAQFVPCLLIGLPAGALVDRLRRQRWLLLSTDIVRARFACSPCHSPTPSTLCPSRSSMRSHS